MIIPILLLDAVLNPKADLNLSDHLLKGLIVSAILFIVNDVASKES